ncbi:hypothetical protein [Amycolatopsis samaneae]|uniref:DUF3558 domain-containing protein n=1 Tax=Amycolatopsis samaneae TaxID=664691 RepID=A0ABW5GCR8_9PSEU
MITRKVTLAAALVLPLVVSGCATETALKPAPQPVKWSPRQPRPADRDPAALAELDKLDLCALVDPGIYAKREANDQPISLVPWKHENRRECRLMRGGSPLLTVTDEESADDRERRYSAVADLGGIKGYRQEQWRDQKTVDCVYRIPVSFRRAIRIDPYFGRAEQPGGCDKVNDFAAAAAAKLPKNLVYSPDGQDTGAVGACADWLVPSRGEDCDPAVPVPVPQEPDKILAAGATDSQVECAVFADAVARVFGPGLRPVATPGACYFVEPPHRVQIEVGALAPADPPEMFGVDPAEWRERKVTSLHDMATVTFESQRGDEFSVYTSPHNDLASRAHLRLRVKAEPERGITLAGLVNTVSEVDKVRAVETMVRVLDQHFTWCSRSGGAGC